MRACKLMTASCGGLKEERVVCGEKSHCFLPPLPGPTEHSGGNPPILEAETLQPWILHPEPRPRARKPEAETLNTNSKPGWLTRYPYGLGSQERTSVDSI